MSKKSDDTSNWSPKEIYAMLQEKDSEGPIGLSPKKAYDLLSNNPQAVLIDIRSTMEHLMIGHPRDAIHIHWLDEPEWTPNPRFVTSVREVLLGGLLGEGEDNPPLVVLICRSGRRSIEAGKALIDAGIHNVFHIDSGFEGPLDDKHHRSTQSGWRFDGLPWQQC
jgi:rhodanese-related sulfurtransferase